MQEYKEKKGIEREKVEEEGGERGKKRINLGGVLSWWQINARVKPHGRQTEDVIVQIAIHMHMSCTPTQPCEVNLLSTYITFPVIVNIKSARSPTHIYLPI